MFSLKTLAAAGVALAAVLAAPIAQAQANPTPVVQVITAGSSAQWGVFAEAAYQLAAASGSSFHHYTAKSTGFLIDSRSTSIPNEPGNLWVVWDDNGDLWAYLSVDSAVGVRAFQAAPRDTVQLSTSATVGGDAALIVWDDGSPDAALPPLIKSALNTGIQLTAANTDIRPEDALFATNRALNTLGYGIPPADLIGNAIKSFFTPTVNVANPVSFALSGTDPFSGNSVTAPLTVPVGAAPIAFIVNRHNANGLGFVSGGAFGIKDLAVTGTHNAGLLFSGQECDTNIFNTGSNVVPSTNVPVFAILREPTSGTMNTTEFTDFNIFDGGSTMTGNTQELNVTASTDNPLHKNCSTVGGVTGMRYRAVGTGDEVNAVKNLTATASNPLTEDQIGYIFFSYEATAAIANSTTFGYLTLDGIDGIQDPNSLAAGEIPLCGTLTATVCSAQLDSNGNFNSFPHLRDGSYRSWSEYRMISDSTNVANVQTLVNQAELVADNSLPDFVPFAPQCATGLGTAIDPGLQVYREHYTQSGVSPNDGAKAPSAFCSAGTIVGGTLGGQDPLGVNNEKGGDVGGAIVIAGPSVTPPGLTGARQ